MHYTEEVLDRTTGELVTTNKGEWITVTELGERYSVSRIKVRTVLREMDFLYVSGGQAHNRHRLTPQAIEAGRGKHIPAKAGKRMNPFDVISPEGQRWIGERWTDALAAVDARAAKPALADARQALNAFEQRGGRSPLGVHGQVLWLCDHHPMLSHTDMATILGVTQQLVSRYVALRRMQTQALRLRLSMPLRDVVKVQLREEQDGGRWPPAEQGTLPTSTTPPEMNPEHHAAA
ncbi:MAG: hypothetical protein WAP03_30600 [Methylorubrum rhodinum]|uniref:hypothetical protein n=1 Tax=Methylorubrum rhodinum TaxID=29428 RepID=UPI003BB01C36